MLKKKERDVHVSHFLRALQYILKLAVYWVVRQVNQHHNNHQHRVMMSFRIFTNLKHVPVHHMDMETFRFDEGGKNMPAIYNKFFEMCTGYKKWWQSYACDDKWTNKSEFSIVWFYVRSYINHIHIDSSYQILKPKLHAVIV